MRLEQIEVSRLRRAPYNPRRDLQPGDHEYQRIKASLDKFDVVEPLVWNERSQNLVSGHQRLKVLEARGDTSVLVSIVDLSDEDERALNLALNKVGGDWDLPKLGELLMGLDEITMNLGGFTSEDFNKILEDAGQPLYNPNEQPLLEPTTVTAAHVDAAAQRLDHRFEGGRELRDVTCPHCGQGFAIDAGA